MANVQKFFEEIIRSEQAKELLSTMQKPENEEQVLDCYVQIAQKLGCTLTAEDIRAYMASKQPCGELDDEELAQVAGGKGNKYCHYSYLDRENCWLTDGCDILFKGYDYYKCHYNQD